MTTVRLNLNGLPIDVDADDGEPLLFVLRNKLKLKGARFGCGLEQCGACLVAVDGEPRHSCTLDVAELRGRVVTTVEALAQDPVGVALIEAFGEEHAGQCGYCLSGILMRAWVLLKKAPRPDRGEIARALDGNLCRCGAHAEILDAVMRAADDCAGSEL